MTSTDDLAARLIVQGSRFARAASTAAGEQRSAVALRALSSLDQHDALRLGDLVRQERITQPAMTATVNRLEADGLVSRAADPTDARACLLTITNAGRLELHAFRRRSAAAVAPALDALTDDDRAVLVRAAELLEQLAAAAGRPHATDLDQNPGDRTSR